MPFQEKKSFSLPFVGGAVILPEIQEVTKSVGNREVTEIVSVLVDQAKKELPIGEDALQYSPEYMIKMGLPMKKVSSVMLYPKSINPQLIDSVDKPDDGNLGDEPQKQTQTQTSEGEN